VLVETGQSREETLLCASREEKRGDERDKRDEREERDDVPALAEAVPAEEALV
jgi:hypothetical protein